MYNNVYIIIYVMFNKYVNFIWIIWIATIYLLNTYQRFSGGLHSLRYTNQ